MTQTSRPWSGVTTGDAGAYSSDQWARTWRTIYNRLDDNNAGVIFKTGAGGGTTDPLDVTETSPQSTNVEVNTGTAVVTGYWYENDDFVNIAIPSNTDASGNDRIDYIALERDTGTQTVRLVHIQGTVAASPSPPSLTQTASIWQIPIAEVLARNLFNVITNSDITYVAKGFTSLDDREGGTNQETYSAGDFLSGGTDTRLKRTSSGSNGSLLTRDDTRTNGVLYQPPARIAVIYGVDVNTYSPITYNANAWRTLGLNQAFLDPNSDVVSVTSNQVEFKPGTYYVQSTAMSFDTRGSVTGYSFRWRNITQGTNEPDYWITIRADSDVNIVFNTAFNHVFTAAAGDKFELQLYPANSPTDELVPTSDSPEIATDLWSIREINFVKLAGG